jgi:Na+/H+ antiporter NhaD/arsenite permease-like protein
MEISIVLVFLIGYLIIAFESSLNINKAATALITGVICWVLYILNVTDNLLVERQLSGHLSDIAGIVFFLLGAMTIVELIDQNNGFDFISNKIQSRNKTVLLWIIAFITFFLSAVLDNLTTAIVMVSLARKLIPEKNDRLLFAGIIIVAANAGGAWSPIGDVTTTMLWIGGQITTTKIISMLFIPSLISLIVPLIIVSFSLKGSYPKIANKEQKKSNSSVFFFIGSGLLLMVPVFKILTHLPPYMGMLLALSVLWAAIEIHNSRKQPEYHKPNVAMAIQKIDTPSILFFTGILLSVAALEATGILESFAHVMIDKFQNVHIVAVIIGLMSAVFDNVPLVAATMGMFDLQTYPADHTLWEMLAFCAGTGGSILIIGSAAGVAAMGMENINFFWYLKRISLIALLGYLAGVGAYLLQSVIL